MTPAGQAFGRYQLLQRLAVGGMAELYRAVLSGPYGFEKTVAIKKILPRLSRNERFRRMFLHEGRIMSALGHRNLVQIFELGEVEGELFICLELVDGCDLAQVLGYLRDGPRFMDPTLVAWIGREICRGLEYIHGLCDGEGRPLQVVHRDVNPKNILISRDGDLKLGDFGIAKSTVKTDQTMQGSIQGKLEYLSPEQACGDNVGPVSDLYSLGLILFELSTLERYLQGKREIDLLDAATQPVWRSIRNSRSDFPPELEEIIKRSLRPEPELRFANASVFVQALGQYLDRAPRSPDGGELANLLSDMSNKPAESAQPASDPELGEVRSLSPKAESRPEPTTRTVPAPLATSQRKASVGSRSRRWARSARWLVLLAAVGASALTLHQIFKPTPADTTDPTDTSPVVSPEPVVPAEKPAMVAIDAGVPLVDKIESLPTVASVPIRDENPPERRTRKKKRKQRKKRDQKKAAARKKAAAKKRRKIANSLIAKKAKTAAAEESNENARTGLRQALQRQRQRLQRKGIRIGDSRPIDGYRQRTSRLLRVGDLAGAEQNLRELESAIDELAVDQLFLDRKLSRLHRALASQSVKSRFSDQVREILRLITGNHFEKANHEMNRIFDSLKRGS